MRNSHLFSRQISQFMKILVSLLLPTLAFTQVGPASSTAVTSVPKLDMTMSNVKVVTPGTTRISTADLQTARLELETVTIRRGDFVVSLLADNGIRQDPQALALVYDLNPQIADIREIEAGQKLILPSIEGSRSLVLALRTGYRVELVRDLLISQHFNAKADELARLETTVDGLKMERFTSPSVKTEVTDLLSETHKALETIKSPEYVVSRKVLNQANADVAAIIKNLNGIIGSGRLISKEDLAQAKESAENVQETGKEVKSGQSGLVPTTINTPNAHTGAPEKGLRVFYAPTGDQTRRYECSRLSTPLTEAIARGKYVFWAMRGNVKVSDDKVRQIRNDTSNIALDIPIYSFDIPINR